MFTHYYTEGIILKKKPVRESDEIITLYTRDFGMINVIGRSIRKNSSKLRMSTSLFSQIEVGFIQGKSYNTLTDVRLTSSFKNVKNDIRKTSLFYRISEITISLIRGEERDEDIYLLLQNSFQKIDKIDLFGDSLKVFYYLFCFRLLCLLGHKIDVEKCVFCGEKVEKKCFFDPQRGDVSCRKCLQEIGKDIYLEEAWFLQKILETEKRV